MKDHGNKTIELDSFLKGSLGRYTELIRLCFQHKWIASLGAVSTVLCTPLPVEKWWGKTLCPGLDTHTRLPEGMHSFSSKLRTMVGWIETTLRETVNLTKGLVGRQRKSELPNSQ